jgi:hypothetical protein
MSPSNPARVRVCRDRCEVCNTVLITRPVRTRRRCSEHLDQLDLIPNPRTTRKSGPKEGTR